jgi:ribonuclease P protein component
VFQNGKKISLKSLGMFFTANKLGYPRLGISLAKRNLRKAISRNRIKRLIRESFRLQQQAFEGVDIVVTAYAEISNMDNQKIFESLNTLWSKLNMKLLQ